MIRRALTPAEIRRILAQPSVLERRTREILLTVTGERVIPEGTAEDRAAFGEMREWLESRPHVAWCKCADCIRKAVA